MTRPSASDAHREYRKRLAPNRQDGTLRVRNYFVRGGDREMRRCTKHASFRLDTHNNEIGFSQV